MGDSIQLAAVDDPQPWPSHTEHVDSGCPRRHWRQKGFLHGRLSQWTRNAMVNGHIFDHALFRLSQPASTWAEDPKIQFREGSANRQTNQQIR